MLSQWTGWGALSKVFDRDDTTLDAERERLHELLDAHAWAAAAHSTLNAHFTDPDITDAVWTMLEATGFNGGRVLEPGAGTGLFIGTAPDRLRSSTSFVGVELEPTTARVAAALYPEAEIRNVGFEHVRDTDGTFDAAIGNVPFGNYPLFDPLHNPDRLSIHNHFMAKSLALVKPGGIVAMVTSRYTLDARNPGPRRTLQSYGDLLAAVRLPSGAHQRLAGTQAVTDVLVFQRRHDRDTPQPFDWETTAMIDVDGGEVRTNSVFAPGGRGRVIGTVRCGRGMYSDDELLVDRPADWVQLLAATVDDLAPALAGTFDHAAPTPVRPEPPVIEGRTLRPGELYLSSTGSLMEFSESGPAEVKAKTGAQTRQLTRLVALRDTAREVMALQTHGHSAGAVLAWDAARARLHEQYDEYRRIHTSPINAFTLTATGRRSMLTPKRFRDDPGWSIVAALEVFDDSTQVAQKAAIFDQWLVSPERTHQGAETLHEALAASLARNRLVDVEFIAGLLASDPDQVRDELLAERLVFASPSATLDAAGDADADIELIPAELYLSGNVRAKLREARAAAAVDETLAANVEALSAVVPEWLPAEAITARLGAVWLDSDTIRQFLIDTFDAPEGVEVEHAAIVGKWEVKASWSARASVAAATEWGTSKADAYGLVDDALNLRPTKVTYRDSDGRTIVLEDETMEANDKRVEIEDRFAEWVWEDPERASRLEAVFNERFNSTVLTKWDGTHLTDNLAGLSPAFSPHQHQLDAVWRVMGAETSTLLPHRVGAGKTAAMVMAGRQLKRTGQITKPLYVVPNHMLEQFSREFAQLYPTAKILVATKDDLAATARRTFVARCSTSDWDAVVMTQSSFKRIAVSNETQTEFVTNEISRYDEAAHAARVAGSGNAAKAIEKAKARLNTTLSELLNAPADDNNLTFEELGVDFLFVDEAHHFKGLPYQTSMQGLGSSSSQQATNMVMKLDWLRSTYGPKVAVFATGTPIANSLAEMWVLKRYLIPDQLAEMEMTAFDSWAGTFARSVTKMELAPEGGRFRMHTRFASFDNVPELLTIFRSFADFLDEEALAALKVPDLIGDVAETVVVARTDELAHLISSLGDRADAIRSGPRTKDAARHDNMLVVCNDGRLGSLDLRLLGRNQQTGTGKVDHVADRVAELHRTYADRVFLDTTGTPAAKRGALQVVFCDKGTPGTKRDFDVYSELRHLLAERDLDPDRVAFIHDAGTDAVKAKLFEACRDGDVDVLVGSTEKMGVGTNIQNRLVALHHVDAPWRPADIEQREGRILRQGNQNDAVHVVRYVTEGSFDAYMWQGIERKARFQGQVIHSGDIDPTVRSIDDLDSEIVLSYAELKAISTGNPLIRQHAEATAEQARLARLATNHAKTQRQLPARVASLERQIGSIDTKLDELRVLDAKRVPTKADAFRFVASNGTVFSDRSEAGEWLRTALTATRGDVDWLNMGELGGQRVLGRWWESKHGDTTGFEIGIAGLPGEVTYDTRELWDAKPHTLMTRVERPIAQIPAVLADTEACRIDLVDQRQRALSLAGTTFPHIERLEALSATIRTMEAEMAALERPAEPAEVGEVAEVEMTQDAPPPIDSPEPTSPFDLPAPVFGGDVGGGIEL